ncbi:hypothetical protein [Desulfococcus sp.]|uniref:hypothetical protein n=1 Tax=Desulfococcus sp. TaxID=2025834 RepID=UPI0035931DCB
MTPRDALVELLERLGASQGAGVLVNGEELAQWPSEAVKAMKAQKIIKKARRAGSAVCPGCEENCAMPVEVLPAADGAPSSFMVCDKRNDINRVPVPPEQLAQWLCSEDTVCGFVAACLGLRRSGKQRGTDNLWEVGVASGDKRTQMLSLQSKGTLALATGDNSLPLAELIQYQDGAYALDEAMVRRMVDMAATADPRYTPSEARREVRKLDTQAMYERWRKEYRNLKKKYPHRRDRWISQKIAKMEIGKGRDAETIRKNMTK